jgi:hypothetical protein
MEKLIDLNNSEHWILLEMIFSKIDDDKIESILDAGSGKTSLSSLLSFFDESIVDAIIFPGDERKKNSIKSNICSDRYILIEKDICKDSITKTYDLVLAHLLLGEATKWGNEFKNSLNKFLNINSKYFIIVDILEDTTIDYEYLDQYLLNNNMKIIAKETMNKKEPQKFDDFVGKTYVSYLIEK